MATTSIFLVGLKAAASAPDFMIENEIIGTDPVTGKTIVRQRTSDPDGSSLLEEAVLELRNLGDGNAGQMANPAGQTRVSIDAFSAGLTLANITLVGTVTTVATVSAVTTVATVTTVNTVTTVGTLQNTQQADGYRLALDQFYASAQTENTIRTQMVVS